MNAYSATAMDFVERLHGVVDDLTRPLVEAHAERLACKRGCAGCCIDDLTVFEIEAAVIARHHPELLEEGEPHPAGGCAFLDGAGGCRVYAHRPYVCRTQGLPLRWGTASGEVRDVCPENVAVDVEQLAPEACWTIGPVEARLDAHQRAADGGVGKRVALRDLFARRAPRSTLMACGEHPTRRS